MAGVAQLVERWIVIPRPPSNISDLAPKAVRTNCVQIERRDMEEMNKWHWLSPRSSLTPKANKYAKF